jgi:hypothetical protein
MKTNETDLQNSENYNKLLIDGEDEIYSKYTNVIIQYLLLGMEKIKNQNAEYVKYILIKGMFTISYVFKILLTHTCNLQLTYHHCQKSYSYYIEFIGQIGDDAVTYLQLNSKDAALFVYKKSIFEILDEVKKKYTEIEMNEKKMKNVSLMIDIYNKIIETEITYLDLEQLKNTEFINKIYLIVGRVNNKLLKLYYSLNDEMTTNENGSAKQTNETTENALMSKTNMNIFFKKIIYIKKFCDILILKKASYNILRKNGSTGSSSGTDVCNDDYKDYIKMIEYFVKKIRKINNLPDDFDIQLISKSFSEHFEEKIKVYSVSKFINWIFVHSS